MRISPHDVYVLLGLVAGEDDDWKFRELASRLAVPVPLIQRALKRLEVAGLYRHDERRVHVPNTRDFLIGASRFVVPGTLGPLVVGVPAAWAAAPLDGLIRTTEELPPVWPAAGGRARGQELIPLHPSAVAAAHEDEALATLLALTDALRTGDARVRSVAADELSRRLVRSPK